MHCSQHWWYVLVNSSFIVSNIEHWNSAVLGSLCSFNSNEGSSSDDTLAIALGVALPVAALILILVICIVVGAIVFGRLTSKKEEW